MVPLSMSSVLGLTLTQKHLSVVFTSERDSFTLSHPCLNFSLDWGARVSCKKVTLFRLYKCTVWAIASMRLGDVADPPEESLKEWVSLLGGAHSRQCLTHVRNKASRWKMFALPSWDSANSLCSLSCSMLFAHITSKPTCSHVSCEEGCMALTWKAVGSHSSQPSCPVHRP